MSTIESTEPVRDTRQTTATLMVEFGDRIESRAVTDGATIGRDPRSHVAIDHPTVSRAHAQIQLRPDGWRFVDLGGQNGSTLGDVRIVGEAPLPDGAAVRIGRVRAWFFTGDGPPHGWTPGDAPQLSGKLMRCRCGHIGWAPSYAAGMTLTCGTCGRDVVMTDVSAQRTAASATTRPATQQVCAACHTEILPAERAHACPDCAATMHEGCWQENRGCAVYGCAQANALDASPTETGEATDVVDAPADDAARGRSSPAMLATAQLGLLAVVGLPIFGVPAIAFGAYRLVAGGGDAGARRMVVALAAFAAGSAGFACSAWWWLYR